MRGIAWRLAAGLMLLASFGARAEVKQEVEDASITARIETLYLLNEHLNPFNIDTSTKDGVVTLTGGVDDEVQRNLAGELASSVEGVKNVVNNILVTPDAENDKDRRNWKQAIKDKSVSAAVRTRLVYDGEFKGLSVGVETINNVTTLYGVVRSEEQREKIGRIAFDTKGVDKLVNNLTVMPPESSGKPWHDVGKGISDELLEKRIERTMLLNRHLSIRDLDVEVNHGVAVLTGSVNTEEQRKLAEELTLSLGGITEVRNDIRLYENVIQYDNGSAEPATPAGKPTPLEDIDPTDETLPGRESPQVQAAPLPQP